MATGAFKVEQLKYINNRMFIIRFCYLYFMNRVIKQNSPIASTLTDMYVVPINLLVTLGSLVVCNRENATTTFKISLAVGGEGDNLKQYLFYDVDLCAKQTLQFGLAAPIAYNDVIRVWSANGQVSFTLFGTSIPANG